VEIVRAFLAFPKLCSSAFVESTTSACCLFAVLAEDIELLNKLFI
jgi:hypothetical protein